MAVWTIAGLTLKEAVRRKTLFGAVLLGLLVLGLSCILLFIRARLQYNVEHGRMTPDRAWGMIYPSARSVVTLLCLAGIKSLGILFALMLAGGSISGEIERGVLAVILPRPIGRWQILLGKWIGLNVVLAGSVLVWTVMAWASLTLQTHLDMTPLLLTIPFSMLYPLVFSTIALSFSTFTQRQLGISMAIFISAIAWFDGILENLALIYDVDILHDLAKFAGLIVPQGTIGWWVEDVVRPLLTEFGPFGRIGSSPRFLTTLGEQMSVPHLDALYVVLYTLGMLAFGALVFQRRDV